MEVILNQNLDKLGIKGDIINVKPGYGRNYLIPKGLAKIANLANKKVAENNKTQAAHKASLLKEQASEQAKTLENSTIIIQVKSSEDSNKIYGSVTPLQISELIKNKYQVNIDPKNISIAEPIKHLGTYDIKLHLHPGVSCSVKLDVVRE